MLKKWKHIETDAKKAKALQKVLGIDPLLCTLLIQRGIYDYDAARAFFRPSLENLHDPFLMKDMEKAVQRLKQATEHKETILLYGDYDVDGTTSVATMYSYLRQQNATLDYYIPDRYKEGYGVSFEGIEYAEKIGAKLIIAMDCGIKAIQQVDRAKASGIDFIICDHHLPEEQLPNAVAVLDPKRKDCAYPYKELSGCGVVFKLIQAFNEKRNQPFAKIEPLLDFLVISIACDIVPITGENRIFAYWGLKKLEQTKRIGLRALMARSSRSTPMTISDIVFGLGPMINASGRLSDACQSVKLMITDEVSAAEQYARMLEEQNQLRKEYDQRISEEAKLAFQMESDWEKRRSIVLTQAHWHKGVIGIVASRMVEAFYRPTIILTQSEGLLVGSARSIKGFDLHQALTQCDDLLVNYGGHKYAAGLKLWPENFYAFQDRFEAIAQTYIPPEDFEPEILISGEIKLEKIDDKFWSILKQLAPFGPGNRNPVFVSKNVKDTGYSRVLKEKHLRLNITQDGKKAIQGIAFGMGKYYESINSGKAFDICYTIQENKWREITNLQLMIKDIKL